MAVTRSLERTVALTLMAILALITLILSVINFLSGDPPLLVVATISAAVVFGGLIILYLRGWGQAPIVLTAFLTLLPIAFLDSLTPGAAVATLVPPAVAIMFVRSPWVFVCGLIALVGVGLRNSSTNFEIGNATVFVIGLLVTTALAVARHVLDDARERALRAAAEADHAREQTEQANMAISANNQLLQEQSDQQQRLIALLNDLEVPAITLSEQTLLIPVIGALDTRRARRLMDAALAVVHAQRARTLILDIAGMSMVDTASARALIQAIEAVKLLGCSVVVSGVSAPVAQTLAELQIALPNVRSVRQLTEIVNGV